MGIGIVFKLIFDILLWGSAALLVGGCYLAYHILKLLIKLIDKLFSKICGNLEEKPQNRRVVWNAKSARYR